LVYFEGSVLEPSPGKVLKDGGGQAEIPKLLPQKDQPPRTDEDKKPIRLVNFLSNLDAKAMNLESV